MRAQRVIDGEVKRKLDCQACGQPKLEGEVCEGCAWPQVGLTLKDDGRLFITLPLCPSTNDRTEPVRTGRWVQERLTDDARDYIASVSEQLRPLVARAITEWGWKPLTYWRGVDLWMILPRTSADCHNYGKVLFDALEAAGVAFNDKYIIPNYRGLWHDTKEKGVFVLA
jgi:Holliday junction resolvase RusA-like endonuclease